MDLKRVEDVLSDFESKLLQDQPVLKNDALRLIAKSKEIKNRLKDPIRVGVIGEFSAGKSLLIGGLVGRADVLPVSEIPTTGNITEILISQGDDPSTVIKQSTVYFITKQEANELFKEFYTELVNTISAVGIENSLHVKSKFIEKEFDQQGFTPNFVEQLDEWANNIWDSVHAGAVHSRVKELIEFTRAASAGTPVFGQKRSVPPENLKQILTIDDSKNKNSNLYYKNLQKPSKTISNFLELESEDIKEFKTLIRKVSLDVYVPKTVWDLENFCNHSRFAIVDFPGIGSADSKVRDRYLCKREIADMQTLVMLLNATRPGSGGANELYNIIQSDYRGDLSKAMLIGIARFNEMPYNLELLESIESNQDDKDDIFGIDNYFPSSPTGSLSDDQVFSANEALSKLLDSALKFTSNHKERIMFLMQNCAFEPYIEAGMESEQLGLGPILQTLKRCEEPTRKSWQYWSEVVDRVDPHSPIKRIKESNPESGGGIKQFQKLIIDHVSSNGQKALNYLIQEELKKIERERVALVNQHQEAKQEDVPKENLAIDPLIQRARQFFDKQKSILDRTPIRFKSDLKLDKEKTLRDFFDEKIPLVFACSHDFTGLLNKVHSESLCLPHTVEKEKVGDYWPIGDTDDDDENDYIKTYKELRLGFQKILVTLLEELKAKCKTSLKNYLEDVESMTDLVQLRNDVETISKNTKNWKIMLNIAKMSDRLYDDIIKALPVVTEDMLQTYFPYAENRMMSWHPVLVNDVTENEYSRKQKLHFMNIILVRQNLCEMAQHVIHKSIMDFEAKTHKFYSMMCEDFRKNLSKEKVIKILKEELQGSNQEIQPATKEGLAIANICLTEFN